MSERFYRRVLALARFLLAMLFPPRVTGLEYVPAQGAAMLCCNHISLRDPVLVACTLNRPIRFIAKQELFSPKPVGNFLTGLGAFPVARGESDLAAMRACIGVLKGGSLLGIFPQGHRNIADDKRDIQTGAAMIALRSRVPVVPVHIDGPYRLFRPVQIRYGAPVPLDDLYERANSEALSEATKRIREAIWQ